MFHEWLYGLGIEPICRDEEYYDERSFQELEHEAKVDGWNYRTATATDHCQQRNSQQFSYLGVPRLKSSRVALFISTPRPPYGGLRGFHCGRSRRKTSYHTNDPSINDHEENE